MHRLPTVTFEHFYLSVSVWHSMEVTHILIFATLIDRLLFLVISRSPPDLQKLAVKTLPLSNLFKLIPLSLLLPVVVILITRLAVALKFLYLFCYGVVITKQFN